MSGYRLWIDDERPTPDGFSWTAKTSEEAISSLMFASWTWDEVSFDHDLGGDDTTRAVMLWMIENDAWPRAITIHTGNPVGREWLLGMANRYAPAEVEIFQVFGI